jgi:putative CocE/NonD family hydrolase
MRRLLFRLVVLLALAVGLYRLRHRLVARLLRLPPRRQASGLRRNVAVPMADGVVLMADHYYPRAPGRFPAIIVRTTYGRGSEVLPVLGRFFGLLYQLFAERGYHVIVQTTRGRFDSGGAAEHFFDAAPDGQATIAWAAAQPWCDGQVAMWGPSYLGYVQWAAAGAPERVPALKAIMPMAIGSRVTQFILPDGAFGLDIFLRWITMLDALDHIRERPLGETLSRIAPDGQARYLAPAFAHLPLSETDVVALGRPAEHYREWLAHPDPDDPYWEPFDHHGRVPKVTAAAHLIGGWYDIGLRGLLEDYAALVAAGRRPYLTIGPWAHTNPGLMAEGIRSGLAWFDAQLKGERSRLRARPVRIFVMGSQEWRELDAWPPPARPTELFLGPGGRLGLSQPAAGAEPGRYRYDPADPTPSLGGPLLTPPSGPLDNRALEARADVLSYTTEPLAEDLEIIGPVRLVLYVRSSLPYADFFGRLCDVEPDGRSINICDGLYRLVPSRAKRRRDGTRRIEIDLWATAHRFRAGHRVRLQVSSGAHPRWSRNTGTREPLGEATRLVVAEQTVYHDQDHPSALVLPLV